jgi:hypothetical protein
MAWRQSGGQRQSILSSALLGRHRPAVRHSSDRVRDRLTTASTRAIRDSDQLIAIVSHPQSKRQHMLERDSCAIRDRLYLSLLLF